MKLAIKINKRISIKGYKHGYAVVVKRDPKHDDRHADVWYYSTLEACFEEIFDYLVRKRISNGKNKTMLDIAKTIRRTKKEIWKILEPLRFVCPKLKHGRGSEKRGKQSKTSK